ncbi:MAG: D-lyxose/D-mannose family sugar isomerase [Fibrobacteres bacterium]|nr:D-lyxose/D-mannose family sugar isomerase [Fibrobacterota bacterium]
MKRSFINTLQKEALSLFERYHIKLPVWGYWSLEEWKKEADFARNVKKRQIGWDVTDFGSGNFEKCGLLLFCLRNGIHGVSGTKSYAEKLMIVRELQETPLHFHRMKEEDIINKGGGVLVMESYKSDDKEGLSQEPLTMYVDEYPVKLKAGEPLRLNPGQSVTVPKFVYHRFYGEPGKGTVLAGEVSQVNDDETDNRFYVAPGRFPAIENDEPIFKPLWTEVI